MPSDTVPTTTAPGTGSDGAPHTVYWNLVLTQRGVTMNIRTILPLLAVLLWATTPASARAEEWQPLTILDVAEFPDDEVPRFRSQSKSIFRGPGGASFIWARFKPSFNDNPPGSALGTHYHHFHEWALVLEGDYVIHEPVSPRQQHGPLYQYVEGTWLDRPAYSIHGGTWAVGGMRSQRPCTLLIFEEGDGSVVTLGADGDHFKPDFPDSKPDPYLPDWESVPAFANPWIVHSGSQLEWERDRQHPERWVKWLSDDPVRGFRARLIKVPPGWGPKAGNVPTYFDQANRFLYLTWGDLAIQRFDAEGNPTERVQARRDWFVHQPPKALISHGAGPASENGAIWLEVTYARGITVGGGPIEAPKLVP